MNIFPTRAAIIAVSSGPAFVAFNAYPCRALEIVAPLDADVDYRRADAGEFISIPAGQSRLVTAIQNAAHIQVRRTDLGAAVSIKAEALD